MQTNSIANTGLEVSILGLGTVKLGRNKAVKYPQSFRIHDDKTALDILETCADCGINLLDTAPAYGNSEQRLGQLLQHTSQPWVISTKVGEIFDETTGESHYDFTPEYLQTSIEASLQRLGRDVLDIVLVHSNGDDEHIIRHHGALEVLNHLKQKGWIRATGMSTKTVLGGKLALDHSDIAMITHNLDYQEEKSVIEHAHRQQKAIFIKKAFASGHSTTTHGKTNQQDRVIQSFECIFENPGVSSVILGSINPKHIRENATKAMATYRR